LKQALYIIYIIHLGFCFSVLPMLLISKNSAFKTDYLGFSHADIMKLLKFTCNQTFFFKF